MKIRTDFVTNSSSSSFISISIKNQEVLQKLKDYELFQELTGFANEDEGKGLDEVLKYWSEEVDVKKLAKNKRKTRINSLLLKYYFKNSDNGYDTSTHSVEMGYGIDIDTFELFLSDFHNATLPIMKAYFELIEKEGGVEAKIQDFVIDKYDSAWGEVFGGRENIEKEFGIICDGLTTITELYYDGSGEIIVNEIRKFDIVNGVTDELLNKIAGRKVSIKKYFKKLKATEKCVLELSEFIKKGLKERGKSDEEIKNIFSYEDKDHQETFYFEKELDLDAEDCCKKIIEYLSWLPGVEPNGSYMEVDIVGGGYEGRAERYELLGTGDRVELKRNPDNSYDKNAIEVFNSRGESLGHIPAAYANILAPGLDQVLVSIESAEVLSVTPLSQRGKRAKNPLMTISAKLNYKLETAW